MAVAAAAAASSASPPRREMPCQQQPTQWMTSKYSDTSCTSRSRAGLARARVAVSGESSATEMTRRRVRAARAAPKSKGSQLGMWAAPAACASESGHAPSKSRRSALCA